MMASIGNTPGRILFIVENLPVPFDRRVWSQATTLQKAGYEVSVICPKGVGAEKSREVLEGVHIYRHPLPIEAKGIMAYPLEYASALIMEFYLTLKVAMTRGFDVIHACNPPDTIFLIGGFFKYLFGKKFVFDHHDINPELYIAKFARKDFFYRLLLKLERWTFKTADISIATNESYRKIAIERGGMDPDKVHIVRSGPKLERLQILPPKPELKKGKDFLVGYVGVIGQQEGIDLLLEAVCYTVYEMNRTDIHFGIVGGGPAVEDMKKLAVDLKVDDFVTFTGRVPDQGLLEMLNTADVCVNPDQVNEMNDKSTMNKIMEYMALGKPIVQFDLTEGRFSAQEASLYAYANDSEDMARKIVSLIDDPEKRREMGAFGKKRVAEKLSWEYESPKLLAAYAGLFGLNQADAKTPERKTEPTEKKAAIMNKAGWYINRLHSMSREEISHRGREFSKRTVSRFSQTEPKKNFQSALKEIANFKTCCLPVLTVKETFISDQKPDADLTSSWASMAQKVQSETLEFLGQEWPKKFKGNKWHLDPVSKTEWPSDKYCFSIPYRHDAQRGDVKFVWELNRLQHLQPVAAHAWRTGDKELEAFVLDEIMSWIDANPPYKGVNWSSGIELALRIVSILVTCGFIRSENIPESKKQKISKCLAQHAYWLNRYPSAFSSANNHLIAEAGALYLLGVLWPELEASEQYRKKGEKILIQEAEKQFHADGIGAEQSPTYTAFTLEWYFLCQYVAEQNESSFPKAVLQKLAAAIEALRWMSDEAGQQPRIGDDDEGRVIFSGFGHESDYVASIINCGAALLNREELSLSGITPRLRDIYFNPAHLTVTDSSAHAHQYKGQFEGMRVFAQGGYTVWRAEESGRKTMLVMDHGPLGYLSIAAHGHADALAVWLHIDDQPVFVDAGTYLYHSGGDWRDRFRGTSLHNTLSINGRNSSMISGAFNWKDKAQTRLLDIQANASGGGYISACHDGYAKQFGLIHERTVHCAGTKILVCDQLLSVASDAQDKLDPDAKSGKLDIEISYLLHPDLEARSEQGDIVIYSENEALVRLDIQEQVDVRILVEDTAEEENNIEDGGWYSPRFGSKQPATRLVFSPKRFMNTKFETRIEVLKKTTSKSPSGEADKQAELDPESIPHSNVINL